MRINFQVGQKWNTRAGGSVRVRRVQPASVVVERVDSEWSGVYAVTLEGRYASHPSDHDLISLAQASPTCGACRGEGIVGGHRGQTAECTETCPACKGTGLALKFYVAGPMTGIPDLNFPAFHAKAAELRAQGYVVINPAEINGGEDELVACAKMTPEELLEHWRKCMRKDIAAVCGCDGIAMLDGWTRSKGATLEHHVAKSLGLLVLEAGA